MLRRRHALGLLAGMACTLGGHAQTPVVPHEYAFDRPELLADQLVWGISHGVSLLGRRCARIGRMDAAEAWIDWREREAEPIRAMHERLAQHYFQRSEVDPGAVATAIGLAPQLKQTDEQLDEACATLREALQQPRYDLTRRRAELLKP